LQEERIKLLTKVVERRNPNRLQIAKDKESAMKYNRFAQNSKLYQRYEQDDNGDWVLHKKMGDSYFPVRGLDVSYNYGSFFNKEGKFKYDAENLQNLYDHIREGDLVISKYGDGLFSTKYITNKSNNRVYFINIPFIDEKIYNDPEAKQKIQEIVKNHVQNIGTEGKYVNYFDMTEESIKNQNISGIKFLKGDDRKIFERNNVIRDMYDESRVSRKTETKRLSLEDIMLSLPSNLKLKAIQLLSNSKTDIEKAVELASLVTDNDTYNLIIKFISQERNANCNVPKF